MQKFACNLSIVPLRAEASHRSEIVSHVLFGETFELLEEGEDFDRILLDSPAYEGWIQKRQYAAVSGTNKGQFIVDLEGAVAVSAQSKVTVLPGTVVSEQMQIGGELFEISGALREASLVDFDDEFQKLILFYRNSPYLWGGRSHQGIDCSGFSQLVYNHFGFALKRDAYQQAEEGQTVYFLTEIKAGDLAFFDNEAGRITHVGVMIDSETIIHAAGRVRIDKMDSEGIFNADLNRYTHKLRIVKRYFNR